MLSRKAFCAVSLCLVAGAALAAFQSLSLSLSAPAELAKKESAKITITEKAVGASYGDTILDMGLFDARGIRVGQYCVYHVSLAPDETKTFAIPSFVPSQDTTFSRNQPEFRHYALGAGTYKWKVRAFSGDWNTVLSTNDNAGTITIK